MSGTGDLILSGSAAVTLGGRNTSTGLTWVQSGTLAVTTSDPFAAAASLRVDAGAELASTGVGHSITVRDVTVNGTLVSTGGTLASTGTLSGTGTITGDVLSTGRFQGSQSIGGDVTVTGTHAPGNSPGVQTISGNLVYSLGGGTGPVMDWELAGNTASNDPVTFDQVVVGTNLSFTTDTLLVLNFDSAGSVVSWGDAFWSTGHQWTIWQVAGTTTGVDKLSIQADDWLDAFGQSFASSLPAAGFTIGTAANGRDVVLTYVTAVPEPSTWVSLLAGAAIVAWRSRRRLLGRRG